MTGEEWARGKEEAGESRDGKREVMCTPGPA